MSHINVTINGRQYRMACEEGQEARLLKLAENLETRIGSLRGKFGEIGDARLTVMAALTVCDELLDASARIRTLEEELTALRDVRVAAADRARATQTAVAAAEFRRGQDREDHAGAESHDWRRGSDRVRFSCPGRSAALLRCAAEPGPRLLERKEAGSRFCEAALRKSYALHRARDTRTHSHLGGWRRATKVGPRISIAAAKSAFDERSSPSLE
jgi:cell division protein ZapA